MTLGKQLSQLRKAANLSQQDVADKLNVIRQTISHWENDIREPDLATLNELAELYQTSVTSIVEPQHELTIGKKIRSLRVLNNLTQLDLSNMLKCSPSAIAMYERNSRLPDIKTTKHLARIFNISTDYLLSNEAVSINNTFDEYINDDINDLLKDIQKFNFEELALLKSFVHLIKNQKS